jgi:hypothetical protein
MSGTVLRSSSPSAFAASLPPSQRHPARRAGREASPSGRSRPRAGLLFSLLLGGAVWPSSGCSPYPDDGEFLAGIVYSANFLAGVRTLDRLPAVGRGRGVADFAPYTVLATTRASEGSRAVSSSTPASTPFWTNGGKRQPLSRESAQTVYQLDTGCAAPPNYTYDERFDLIHLDRQYPIFTDIPEVLSTNSGRGGRTGAYSAVVEVVHLAGSGAIPCQSMKRADTVKGRIGLDLREVRREYRLLQIIDPVLLPATPPLPSQLGFYNQLVVPYIDMGPVPLEPDGNAFRTMALYRLSNAMGMSQGALVFGSPDEAGPAYSPICRDYTLQLPAGTAPPVDAMDPLVRTATKTEVLTSCLVCKTLDKDGLLDCPFASSQVVAP